MTPEELPSLTVEILKAIRDEVRGTNQRLDQSNQRLDQSNQRLEQLERRMIEMELRLATEITSLAGTVREMTAVLRAHADLRPRVERCERDIVEIRERLESPS